MLRLSLGAAALCPCWRHRGRWQLQLRARLWKQLPAGAVWVRCRPSSNGVLNSAVVSLVSKVRPVVKWLTLHSSGRAPGYRGPPLNLNVRSLQMQCAQAPFLFTRAGAVPICTQWQVLRGRAPVASSAIATPGEGAKASRGGQSVVRASRGSAAPGRRFVVVAAGASTGFGPGSAGFEPVQARALGPLGRGGGQRRGSGAQRWGFGFASVAVRVFSSSNGSPHANTR